MIATVVCDTKENTIQKFVRKHISIDTNVNTDEYRSYNNLSKIGYNHSRVNHACKEYVNQDSCTNTIEGFWSQLKRSIHGTYHFVSPKYLQSYVNEFAYRYNRRNQTQPMFASVIAKAWTLC